MPKAIVLDTETTGLEDPDFCEVAWIGVSSPANLVATDKFEQRYKPSKPIGFGAMAVSHITNIDVANCPSSSEFSLPDDVEYMIGHNIDFDWGALKKPNVKRICTRALAKLIYPDCDSHSLSALIYYKFDEGFAKAATQNAHEAMADVLNCRALLGAMMSDYPNAPQAWNELWELSEQARIPKVMPFGKHKGMNIGELPNDYVIWLKKQDDVDPYLMRAIIDRDKPMKAFFDERWPQSRSL